MKRFKKINLDICIGIPFVLSCEFLKWLDSIKGILLSWEESLPSEIKVYLTIFIGYNISHPSEVVKENLKLIFVNFSKLSFSTQNEDIEFRSLLANLQAELFNYLPPVETVLVFSFNEEFEKITKLKNQTLHKSSTLVNTFELSEEASNFLITEPDVSLDQIVLPDDVKREICQCIKFIENIDKIYDKWGYQEIDPARRIILNFYGPPWHGKNCYSSSNS